MIYKKKKKEYLPNIVFFHSGAPQGKSIEEIKKYLDLARELRKIWNMRGIVKPVVIGMLWTVFKNWERSLRVRNQKMNRDNPNYSFVEISENSEKSPGDLRKLVVN